MVILCPCSLRGIIHMKPEQEQQGEGIIASMEIIQEKKKKENTNKVHFDWRWCAQLLWNGLLWMSLLMV